MTNRSLIINGDSFQSKINTIEDKVNKVAETLELISNNMKQIDGTNDVWKSETAVEMHNDYIELQKNFEKINVELCTYVIFLKNVLESYTEQENNLDIAIEKNSDNLDVNE